MNISDYMTTVGQQARSASRIMAKSATSVKNQSMNNIAKQILQNKQTLIDNNQLDLKAGKEKKLDDALLDRLELTDSRILAMAEGLEQIASLADPIGEVTDLKFRPSGIQVGKMRVPLGVVGIIYESRPNVTADAAGLCLKSGNAVILRGGSEALNSNLAIANCISTGLAAAKLPKHAVQVIETTDRSAVGELIAMPDFVDVIIPRGGKGLIERISQEARVPVIKHLDGICHVFIDQAADINKAVAIAFNAKTQRYGTCNTMECLLIHESIAETVLKQLMPLFDDKQVEVRGCSKSKSFYGNIKLATDEDYATEYLAPILSLKIVDGLDDAIEHIQRFGSQHTDTIVTEDFSNAQRFLREVDSSSVMVNASTRFADGFEYGLGAEIGISTDKFHARGPVGLEGLTSQKYIVIGSGQIRE